MLAANCFVALLGKEVIQLRLTGVIQLTDTSNLDIDIQIVRTHQCPKIC